MPGQYGSLAAIKRDIKRDEKLVEDATTRLKGLKEAAQALEGLPALERKRRSAKAKPRSRGRTRR